MSTSLPALPSLPSQSSSGADFGNVLGGIVGSAAGAFMGGGPIGFGGFGGGGMNQMFQRQEQLLQQQAMIQERSARFQTMSNISKTEHDTRVNSIRNMKA